MAELHESRAQRAVRREVRSPRAAAIAGIVYAILIITVMVMTRQAGSIQPENITGEILESWSATFSLILIMIPFAGIAFLWFTGVVRDLLREREGRFFATLFFGSGITQVLLLFIWGAILGTIMNIANMDTRGIIETSSPDIYIFGSVLMNEIIGNFYLRMAGVYMLAIGTLWTRTSVMPRWLTLITYVLALGFLVAAERIREARYIFPTWVLVVSVYILILNYRSKHQDDQDSDL